MRFLSALSDVLSKPALLYYVLPVLMVYLTIGTVAQKYIGLYEATQIFFASPIIWVWGAFPLPGLPLLMAVIFMSLLFKLLFKSAWNLKNSGIIVTHIGALLLLFGGLLTALLSEEGYVDLAPGESADFASDYNIREVVILDEVGEVVKVFDHQKLRQDMAVDFEAAGLRLKILEVCENCAISRRGEVDTPHYGMAQHMRLGPAPLALENEENMAGLTFEVEGSEADGVYLALEHVPKLAEVKAQDKVYKFAIQKRQTILPFRIELLDFKRDMHPGTEMAKAYESHVRIYDEGAYWDAHIRMNEPLRYKGYTFFQSSFLQTEQGDVSVLAMVKNAGWTFPYISGIVMCLGMILHLWMRRVRTVSLAFVLAGLLSLCLSTPAVAKDFDLKAFSEIPVMHEGRIKPMDSYARALQKKFSGRDREATQWLSEVLFNPTYAKTQPAFKISNPDLLNMLELEKRRDGLFSYDELLLAFSAREDVFNSIVETPDEQWTPAQREFVLLQQDAALMGDLLASLGLFLPLSTKLPKDVPQSLKPYVGKVLTYVDVLEFQNDLQKQARKIVQRKGDDISRYSESEQAIVYLSFSMANLRSAGANNDVFRIVPSAAGAWLSPWQMTLEGSDLSSHKALLDSWRELAAAYHAPDFQAWDEVVRDIEKEMIGLSGSEFRAMALKVEHIYNQWRPLKLSTALYGLGLIVLGLGVFFSRGWISNLAVWIISSGFALHALSVVARIYILGRPPVSTLYESVIFSGLVAVLYGLVAFMRSRALLWLFVGAGSGFVLHILGFSQDQDGDSFLMLTAVLNTNFWLATHVICITAGYAFCLITSFLAHMSLVQTARGVKQDLSRSIHVAALMALLFSAVGTVLGGIWADQSWGRFWGWDPKENGALLIVLWLIWVLHGRLSGHMGSVFFNAGLAYLSVIVALSWFGVNLLSVGLHAYGFTDSMAFGLGGFLALETAVIAGLVFVIKTKKMLPF